MKARLIHIMNNISTAPKYIMLAALGAMVIASTGLKAKAAEVFTIDTAHSSAGFSIRNLGVQTVKGNFSDITGKIVLDKEKPAGSSVEISIGAASVNTGIEKRDKHLRSADFFDVQKYPAMTFKSTDSRKPGASRYYVIGDFTLHGVKKSISVNAEQVKEWVDKDKVNHMEFTVDFSINRSDYGMTFDTPPISDKVNISLDIQGIRK